MYNVCQPLIIVLVPCSNLFFVPCRYELCTCTLMNMKSDGMLGAQVLLLLPPPPPILTLLLQVLQNPRKVDELVQQVAARSYSASCVDFVRRCLVIRPFPSFPPPLPPILITTNLCNILSKVPNPAERWGAKQLQVSFNFSITLGLSQTITQHHPKSSNDTEAS